MAFMSVDATHRRTWYLAFGTRKGMAQMPHADYDEWVRSLPYEIPRIEKGAYGAPGADFWRVGSRVVPVWLAVSLPIR